jgi:hypothetical protein
MNTALVTGPFPGFIQDIFSDILAKHIEKCPSCASERSELEKADQIFAGLSTIRESDGFDAKFRAKLSVELSRKRRLTFLQRAAIFISDIYEYIRDIAGIILAPLAPAHVKAFVTVTVSLFAVFTGLNFYGSDEPSISGISGSAYLLRSADNGWFKVDPGIKLRIGDEVRSIGASEITISLRTKYHIKLRPDSAIEIARLNPRNRHGICRYNLKKGDMLVDIDKPFKGSKFEVETPGATVRALGTKFMVSRDREKDKTWVGVLEGKVDVSSRVQRLTLAKIPSKVVVDAGMRTEVIGEAPPLTPIPLLIDEWQQLSELYMLGKLTKVALLLSNDKNRVLELLSPCLIFIQDREPRSIPRQLEEALYLINEANKNGDKATHIEGIHKLEEIVQIDPKAEYNPQLLLFIGAYYSYIGEDIEAIRAFSAVFKLYPDTSLRPLAKAAIAYIKESRFSNKPEAKTLYLEITKEYPTSPESSFAKDRLRTL